MNTMQNVAALLGYALGDAATAEAGLLLVFVLALTLRRELWRQGDDE